MRSAWRLHAVGERHVPVEMRFVDMFMAALGALIFMAMLLSFLLRYLPNKPHAGPGGQPAPPASALQIVTRSLPPARVGEPYEVAFAYRGGSGPVVWQVPAGREEIPAGLRFDAQRGILSGTPGKRGTARFVLQASDFRGGEHRRPFELMIEAPKKAGRRFETLSAVVLIALLLLIWLASLAALSDFRQKLATLQEAWTRGQVSMTWRRGLHEEETVRLPEGIEIYQERLQAGRWFNRALLFVLLLSLAWFAWRIWGG
jgi:hypothetical protein